MWRSPEVIFKAGGGLFRSRTGGGVEFALGAEGEDEGFELR